MDRVSIISPASPLGKELINFLSDVNYIVYLYVMLNLTKVKLILCNIGRLFFHPVNPDGTLTGGRSHHQRLAFSSSACFRLITATALSAAFRTFSA